MTAVRTTIGITLAFLTLVLVAPDAPAQEQNREANPLAPPDTSSPRATLRSFMENVEAAFRPLYLRQSRAEPFDSPAGRRALRCLDLANLPPAQTKRMSKEAVLLLTEVLGRVELPDFDDVPGAEEMAALPEGERREWKIPGTAIEIVRIEEGARRGEYLFSAETVARARDFYDRARRLPYRQQAMIGLYERIVYEPGSLFPHSVVAALPYWARRPIAGQTGWQWGGFGLGIVAWVLIAAGCVWASRSRAGPPRYWRAFVLTLAIAVATLGLRHFFDSQIRLVGLTYEVADTSLVLITYLICAAATIVLGSGIGETIIASPRIDPRSVDAHLIRLVARALGWLGAVALALLGATEIGVPLTALVTSLGVGGFAFALAARPTLENLVAGVTLFIDRPVRVGTFCAFDDVVGQVEEIGIRSTKVRRWGGNRITIPNAQFAEYRLDNYDDTRNLWIRATLALRYETTPDQLRFVLAHLREMLVAHPRLTGDPRARLAEFGDFSLNVEILTYADTGSWTEWHAIREDVFLRIMDVVAESGTSFAFPSQTTYLARDPGLDETRSRSAEETVRQWRQDGSLPFPDMAVTDRERLRASLEFPPPGSVSNQERPAAQSPPEES